MANLPTNRTTASSAADHVDDHNTVHAFHNLIDAAGDLIVGTGADTAGKLAKGTALQVLRVNSGATALEWAAPSGTSVWETVQDLAGTTLTGWTALNGTWAANAGGYLERTDTGASYGALRLNASVFPGAALVVQSEVRFPTGGAADSRAFLSALGLGDYTSTHDPWPGLRTTGSVVYFQRGDQATFTGPTITLNRDTWYTLRAEYMWHAVTLSVDGTRQFSQRIMVPTTQETNANRFSLVTFSGQVHFRNVKIWRLAGPT
jgi:hypothetical protein